MPECEGAPIVGVDLGGSRSWSAAAALWPSGRIEAWALAPGVPSLSTQEHDDHVAEGAYLGLVRAGGLSVDEGRAVPDVGLLLSRIWSWSPSAIVSDPYRAPDLESGGGRDVSAWLNGLAAAAKRPSNVQALRSRLLDTANPALQRRAEQPSGRHGRRPRSLLTRLD